MRGGRAKKKRRKLKYNELPRWARIVIVAFVVLAIVKMVVNNVAGTNQDQGEQVRMEEASTQSKDAGTAKPSYDYAEGAPTEDAVKAALKNGIDFGGTKVKARGSVEIVGVTGNGESQPWWISVTIHYDAVDSGDLLLKDGVDTAASLCNLYKENKGVQKVQVNVTSNSTAGDEISMCSITYLTAYAPTPDGLANMLKMSDSYTIKKPLSSILKRYQGVPTSKEA